MSDLTLKEAFAQYSDECREVSLGYTYHWTHRDKLVLIGACVVWLKGKIRKTDAPLDWTDEGVSEPTEVFSETPLVDLLKEVREHMEAKSDEQ